MAATEDQVTEITAEFMTTFYGIQVGSLETQEFPTQPVPFWLVNFSEAIKGPLKQLYFVVVLPDGNVVEPRVEKRLKAFEFVPQCSHARLNPANMSQIAQAKSEPTFSTLSSRHDPGLFAFIHFS